MAAQLGQPTGSKQDDRGREIVAPFVTRQTGEQPDDPFFDRARIIVTTYDQLLSGLLSGPYGLSSKLHNINSAAVMGALVVFDEFHLMQPNQAFLTAAACLQLFRGFSQCAWMTATATAPLEDNLQDALFVKPVPASEQERDKMLSSVPAVAKVKREIQMEKAELSPESVLDQGLCRSVVLFNTVDRSQIFFKDLKREMQRRSLDFPALLLHSRFFREHRRSKEQRLRELFRDGSKGPAILVATQVIEAGIDISSDHLHTELCPMNSLIQRAGRCARFPGEIGVVHVYPLPANDRSWLPYGTVKREDPTLSKTRDLLRFEGKQILDPVLAAQWVEIVHANRDQEELRVGWRNRQATCVTRIEQASILRDPRRISDLIRDDDLQSVRVLICEERTRPGKPAEREAVGVSRWALAKLLTKENAELGWFWDGADAEPWKPLGSSEDLAKAYIVCLRPAVAAYSEDLGLQLNEAGTEQSPARTPPPRPGYAPLTVETWEKHARCVATESARRLDVEDSAPGLLEEGLGRNYQLSVADLEAAAHACGLLHDLGKLQQSWQRWAEAAQKAQDPNYYHAVPLAHTDFDWTIRRNQLPMVIRRPPHAAAGAYYGTTAVGGLLSSVSDKNRSILASCCAAAILGHHGGWLPADSDLNAGEMWIGWERLLSQVAGISLSREVGKRLESQSDKRRALQKLLDLTTGSDNLAKFWPLVAFLTRTLRLSDQRATADGGLE
jgi:CRISPR-associated endonuclease/helicase Cas3